MKIVFAALLLLASAFIHESFQTYAQTCDESLWKHVFAGDPRQFRKPEDRLQVIDRCKTVRGTIVKIESETDGDSHIRLLPDREFKNLLNAKNRQRLPKGQSGHLVIEPICQKKPTKGSALKQKPCFGNFRQRLPALVEIKKNLRKKRGTHVEVIGAYVTDVEHGWNEIHPVTSIRVIP